MALHREPIAVIGLGCRFPSGIASPDDYWSFLMEGRESVRDTPADRWAGRPPRNRAEAAALRTTPGRASYLDDIAGFDAGFFGIAPREARLMDPQQRIALEVAWEALEHAGIQARRIAGTPASVHMGVCQGDYGRLRLDDLGAVEPWTGIGASYSAVANRISHALDLRGASVVVDTACSASLVAVHQACQALWLEETGLALAGGAMVMASPGYDVALAAAGALAPDGRCKAFDARADGYGRGEGCGVVVLRRLSDARRDGQRVLAVVAGGAVRQDGRTDGIMAPSRTAQEALTREAYRVAGVDPAHVDYVEAHGTGTPAGDPAEVRALGSVLGRAAGRAAHAPCLIGSVKPNIGHLEAAAGIAGLIKVVSALDRSRIPPTRVASGPDPAVPWRELGLCVVTEARDWPATGRPRTAGVAAHGYGGTLAHLVLTQAPPAVDRRSPAHVGGGAKTRAGRDAGVRPVPDGSPVTGPRRGRSEAEAPPGAGADTGAGRCPDGGPGIAVGVPAPRVGPGAAAGPLVYAVSGATPDALRAGAARLAGWVAERADADLTGVARTLARHREHLGVRGAVVADGREELLRGLRALAGPGGPAPVRARESARGPVWVFSGHGAQWAGMGRELLDARPEFAEAVRRIDGICRKEMDFSPLRALRAGELGAVDRVQVLTYAVQIGLAAVWRAHGVYPGAVIGHSVGEIAAAVTAGVFDERDGARLACRRSRLLRRVEGEGAMVLVGLDHTTVAARLRKRYAGTGLAVAVHASPGSTVVSGAPAAVARLSAVWAAEGVPVRRVASDVAFHGPHMEPLCADLASAVKDVVPGPALLPLYTTALPDPRDGAERDGAYWAANLLRPVRFARAVAAAAEDGHRHLLEISAHPVLAHSIVETLEHGGVRDTFVTYSLRRERPELRTLREGLAALHCHGAPADLAAVLPAGPHLELPCYPWQRQRLWVEAPTRSRGHRQHDPAGHTLLGDRTVVPGTTPVRVWRTLLDHRTRPYPGGHAVHGSEIVPAAVLVQTLTTAVSCEEAVPALRDMELLVPLATGPAREVRVVHQDGHLMLSSRLADPPRTEEDQEPDGDGEEWLTHTTALVERAQGPLPAPLPDTAAEPLPAGYLTERLRAVGVGSIGFPWRVRTLYGGPGAVTARVAADPGGTLSRRTWASLLDAAFSLPTAVFTGPAVLRMPARVDRVLLLTAPPPEAVVRVRGVAEETVDVDIDDARTGTPAARLRGLRFGRAFEPAPTTSGPCALLRTAWQPWEPVPAGREAVSAGRAAVGRAPVSAGRDAAVRDPDPADLAPAVRDPGPAGEDAAVGDPDSVVCDLAPTVRDATVREPDSAPRDLDPVVPGVTRPAGVWVPGRVVVVGDPVLARGLGPYLAGAGVASEVRGDAEGALAAGDAVVFLAGPTADPDPLGPTSRFLRAARAVAAVPGGVRLWCVTRGVRAARAHHTVAQSALWGLGRALAGERPALWGGTVDLPEQPGRADLGVLAALLSGAYGTPDEDVIGVDDGRLTVARLVPAAPSRAALPLCRPDGTYLITGGLGALGLRTARWLTGQGARRLLLLGRTPLPPRRDWDAGGHDQGTAQRIAAVRALEAAGTTVRTVAADITDPAGTGFLAGPEVLGMPPVAGVVHAAGVFRGGMLDAVDEASLRAVMGAKAAGALVLHRLFPPGSVDFLALFSSAGHLLRLPGQGAYAAANALLEGVARHRRAAGHDDTVALSFTSWLGLGMAAGNASVDAGLAVRGTAGVTAEEALRAWERADTTAAGHYTVLRLTDAPDRVRPPLFRGLRPDPDPAPGPGSGPDGSGPAVDGGSAAAGPEDWRLLPEPARGRALLDAVRSATAQVLGTTPEAVDPHRPLAALGVDSLLTVMLRTELERRLAVELPPTLLWNRPTAAGVTDHLARLAPPADQDRRGK